MNRTLGQFVTRLFQRTKDPSALKSLKDSTSSSSKCYAAGDQFVAGEDQKREIKRAEESLRTVMYLSSWAPT